MSKSDISSVATLKKPYVLVSAPNSGRNSANQSPKIGENLRQKRKSALQKNGGLQKLKVFTRLVGKHVLKCT